MEKCLTVVGRAKSARKFTESFIGPLIEVLGESEFEIDSVESIGDLSDLDGMSRYLSFVLISDGSQKKLKLETLFSELIGLQLGVRLFDNIEDAQDYAKDNYNYKNEYPTADEIEDEEDDEFDELIEFTAEEIEEFLKFESLFRTGKLATLKGKVYDQPTTIMAQIINGPDQIRVTPYAIMVNSDLLENMKLPNID